MTLQPTPPTTLPRDHQPGGQPMLRAPCIGPPYVSGALFGVRDPAPPALSMIDCPIVNLGPAQWLQGVLVTILKV